MDEATRSTALAHEVSRRTFFRVAGLGVSAGVLATGLKFSTPAAAQDQQKVVVVLPEEPPDLDPFYYALSHIPVTRNIYEALVDRDPIKSDNIPGLATKWETTDPTTWRFTLRTGVTYHNGAAFNAESAAWAINWAITQKTQASGNFIAGTTAKAVDDVTLDITTPSVDPILPRRLYLVGLPEPQSFQADPTNALRAPVGTGPYQLVEFKGGDHISVQAFANYWGGAPTIAGADFVYREESSVRVSMIQTGEAQIARDVAPQDVGQTHAVSITIPETPFLRLDVPSPPLDDLRVRQAIDCGIDRAELVKTAFGGYAEPAAQMVTSAVVGFDASAQPTPYDAQKAKDLVAAAKADGAPLDLQLTIFGRNGIYANAAEAMQIVQAWLQDAGLNVTVNMMDVKPWTDVILQQPIPTDRRGILQSSAGVEIGDPSGLVDGYFTSTGSQSPLRDPKLDQMAAAASVLSGDERDKAYRDIFKYEQDTWTAVIPMVHTQAIYAVADGVTWQPRTDNLIRLKDVTLSGS
jgi:peptide/nickel transport system substrate-binding protein